ncbi:MAG: glycoside hydrolase family 20 zincin-like fold domain-containing protein, partial [Bacteroidales bacterium]|nr:glycoside hydrolase family 20 zincin-like fold domain-containing protein [Bacteroidales bacterium]
MKNYPIIISIIVLMTSCDKTTQVRNSTVDVAVLPHPKEITISENTLFLSSESNIHSSQEELQPLLQLFESEVKKLTGITIEPTKVKNQKADIIFEIDSSLSEDEYYLNVDKTIQVTGGSYQALTMAKATLLQL